MTHFKQGPRKSPKNYVFNYLYLCPKIFHSISGAIGGKLQTAVNFVDIDHYCQLTPNQALASTERK